MLGIEKDKREMLKIEIKDGNIEKALKKYKSKVIKTKQLKNLRGKRYYEKPTSAKRVKMQKAIRVKNWNLKDQA
jgi:small subunit ribosomal protein S21